MLTGEERDTNSTNQANRFMQSALDALSAHVAILDEDAHIIAVNAAWRRFADGNHLNAHDHGIGTNYLSVCDNAAGHNSYEARWVAQGIRDVLSQRLEEFYIEYPCHSPQIKRWFVVHVTRFMWDGHLRLVVAHQNVTELKAVQIELDESKKRIEAILNNVANGIITIGSGGQVELVNPAAARIFGYTPDELVGLSVTRLFAPPYRDSHHRSLLAMLQANPGLEVVGQRQDHTLFPMNFTISELYLGHRRLYTGIVQDLTDRKRMESELLDKERIQLALEKERDLREFKNRFISMMSHELRTPLSSIRLSSDMLKLYGDKAPADEKLMYLENIATQVEHLTALVKDMLIVSRSEISVLDFRPELIDLVALVRQIVTEYQIAYHNSHHITLVSDGVRLNAMLDPKLMRQVLNNLLTNAVKYSPVGSEINVSIQHTEVNIFLSVADNGIGIPEDDIPRLFDPFQRAGNVNHLPGTGLGLSVVKQAVEMHQGTVEVKSQMNRGTTFYITLPNHSLSLENEEAGD